MKINSNSPGVDLRRTELASQVQAPAESGKKKVDSSALASSAPRNDRVQISDAGRALAAQAASSAANMATADGLSPDRVAQIRNRILEGAYNSVEVVDQVARRMLERGDI